MRTACGARPWPDLTESQANAAGRSTASWPWPSSTRADFSAAEGVAFGRRSGRRFGLRRFLGRIRLGLALRGRRPARQIVDPQEGPGPFQAPADPALLL